MHYMISNQLILMFMKILLGKTILIEFLVLDNYYFYFYLTTDIDLDQVATAAAMAIMNQKNL